MRYIVLVAAVAAVAIALSATGSADAHKNSPAKRVAAGWDCFDVPSLGMHCTPPGVNASSATITLQVFDTSDPLDPHAALESTELLIRADLYHGQPCRQEGLDEWVGLDLFGDPAVDYYACHHR